MHSRWFRIAPVSVAPDSGSRSRTVRMRRMPVLVAGGGKSGRAAALVLAASARTYASPTPGRTRRRGTRRSRRQVRRRRRTGGDRRCRAHRHISRACADPPDARGRNQPRRPGHRRGRTGLAAARSRAAPWLALTGTNGKTTTVGMLSAILRAAGPCAPTPSATSASRCSTPSTRPHERVRRARRRAVQLPAALGAQSLRAHSPRVLNLAADHLDWHGTMAAYAADKARGPRRGAPRRLQRRRPGGPRVRRGPRDSDSPSHRPRAGQWACRMAGSSTTRAPRPSVAEAATRFRYVARTISPTRSRRRRSR